MELKDRNGKSIELGATIRDDQGEYVVQLGNFDKEDGSEVIAKGKNNGINKLLSSERSKLFEVIDSNR
jgi:hypothetical protein